jgi:anti-sigma B factor antagonist
MAVSDLTVRSARLDNATALVALEGELDLYSADAFRGALDEALEDGVARLAIDLSAVDFIDSVALGVLANAMKRLRAAGGGLAVISRNPQIVRVFEITGLDRMLVLAPSLNEALEKLPA